MDRKLQAMGMSSDPVFCSFEAPSCPGTCRGCPNGMVLNASLTPNGSGRFNPLQPTVGDLVDVNPKVAASQELSNVPQQGKGVGDLVSQKLHDWQEPHAEKSGVGDLVNEPFGAKVQGQAASDHSLVFSSFNSMRPTIGDLVGATVEAAASAPLVVRRINGQFDATQKTVGDLVDANPRLPQVIAGVESDDFVMHPRRIRMCSR